MTTSEPGWRYQPADERSDEAIWAVCALEQNEVTLRGVTYQTAEWHAHQLVRWGHRNIWVYPADELAALLKTKEQFIDLLSQGIAAGHEGAR